MSNHHAYQMSNHRAYQLYAHITWHTWKRVGCIDQAVVEDVKRAVAQACREAGVHLLRGAVLADHVHLVVSYRPSTRLSDFIRLAKSGAAMGDGFLIEPAAIEVTRHDLVVPGLPHELDGFRIACLTDVHLSGGMDRAAQATLEHLARERPHVVTLIGDICNHLEDLEYLIA